MLLKPEKTGMGSHQSGAMESDSWITPPFILEQLGSFDRDPCTPEVMPWQTATRRFTPKEDGLLQPWSGRVWCNPPYGNTTGTWLEKCVAHKDCIALIFARTETRMFFKYVWNQAHAVLFLEGRLHFHYPDGRRADANAGAPSVLIAYNERNAEVLRQAAIPGKFIYLNTPSCLKS